MPFFLKESVLSHARILVRKMSLLFIKYKRSNPLEKNLISTILVEKKSDFHVRQKRVINNSLHGNNPGRTAEVRVPYLVSIQKNGREECGGIVLTSEIILTAAHCFHETNEFYTVLTASLRLGGRISRNITSKLFFPHYNPNELEHDLAMLFIYPPIDLEQSPNRRIELYNGTLFPNTPAALSGWSINPVRR